MKKRWIIGASFALIIVMLTVPVAQAGASSAVPKQLIVIDPAHGGKDAGVRIDEEKLEEKDLTLSLALALQRELEKSGNFSVRLTRDKDRELSTAGRLKLVRDWHPDLYLGIHINAGFGKGASGYEFYFPGFNIPGASPPAKGESAAILQDMTKNRYLNSSVRLAQSIQRQMERVFPRKGRGLRDAPLVILDDLTIPAVVVEIGFATNVANREKLTDPKTQRAVVKALGNGIQEYFR